MNDNTPWAVFALVFSLFSLFVSILHHLAPEAAREDAPPVEQALAFGGEEADELADAEDERPRGERPAVAELHGGDDGARGEPVHVHGDGNLGAVARPQEERAGIAAGVRCEGAGHEQEPRTAHGEGATPDVGDEERAEGETVPRAEPGVAKLEAQDEARTARGEVPPENAGADADGDDGKQVGEVRDEDEADDPADEGVECGGVHGPESTTRGAPAQRRATR